MAAITDRAREGASKDVKGAIALIVRGFAEPLTLEDLASAAAMPLNTLTRHFNRHFGMSPMRWLWTFRTVLAAEFMILAPGWPIGEIAARCGFMSPAHFARKFHGIFGMSPTRFRQQVAGVEDKLRSTSILQDSYARFIERHAPLLETCLTAFAEELKGVAPPLPDCVLERELR